MSLDPPPGWKDLADALQNLLVRLQAYDPSTMTWAPLEVPLPVSDQVYTVRIDATGGYTYIGKATPGSDEADSLWRVTRVDSTGNVLFADGISTFTKKWSLRATYTYL